MLHVCTLVYHEHCPCQIPWCSGYHVSLTHSRSPVRSRVESYCLFYFSFTSPYVFFFIFLFVSRVGIFYFSYCVYMFCLHRKKYIPYDATTILQKFRKMPRRKSKPLLKQPSTDLQELSASSAQVEEQHVAGGEWVHNHFGTDYSHFREELFEILQD